MKTKMQFRTLITYCTFCICFGELFFQSAVAQGVLSTVKVTPQIGREVNGSLLADTLRGSIYADVIHGKAGNDIIIARDGADKISGDLGNDLILPGPGGDLVQAGPGDDTIVIEDECELRSKRLPEPKVLDGGVGTDTLVLPVPLQDFIALGGKAINFEKVVVRRNSRALSECAGINVHYLSKNLKSFVHGVNALKKSNPLFVVPKGELSEEEALLVALKTWIIDHQAELRLMPGLTNAAIDNMFALAPEPTYQNLNGKIFKLKLLYHGYEIGEGDGQFRLHVTYGSSEGGEVNAIAGLLFDPRLQLVGYNNHLSPERILVAMRNVWLNVPEAKTSGPVQFSRPELVAMPTAGAMGYRADVFSPIGTSIASPARKRVGTLIVNALNGVFISFDGASAEDAVVRGTEMDDDPATSNQHNFSGLPTKVFGNEIELDPACGGSGKRNFRLGDAARFSVFDYNNTVLTPMIRTEKACADDDVEFVENDATTFDFISQDFFVKTIASTNIVDPFMGELITHGAAHTYSWDHHPSIPAISHRTALVVGVNKLDGCGTANGVFEEYWAEEGSPWFSQVDAPLWSPLLFNEDGEVMVDIIQSCNKTNASLLHEIGHYYDAHNTYGTMGDDGVTYTQCCLDRPNESMAMRESVAQLFLLYFVRRHYAGLPYNLSTVETCNLASIASHLPGTIVDSSCPFSDVWTLPEKRPTQDHADTGCSLTVGYDLYPFYQAYWELLFGKLCNSSHECVGAHGDFYPENYADRWLEALLAALQMGNGQSLVQLWDNIQIFIAANYPDDLEFLISVRNLHQLLPLEHGLDPDCLCPRANGGCV